MRIRFRFSKLGKIRFTSQRDVARMWERALRRARLPLAYTSGFSPRPQLSFGLALPTTCESLAEYVDVVLDGERPETAAVDPASLPALLTGLLPEGLEVEAAEVVEARAPSLQQEVTSCSWAMAFRGVTREELEAQVAALVAAPVVTIVRERKGRREEDDLRPQVVSVAVVDPGRGSPAGDDPGTGWQAGAPETGSLAGVDPGTGSAGGTVGGAPGRPAEGGDVVHLVAELATRPRGVRPAELVRGLIAVSGGTGEGGAAERIPVLDRACRTQQWIERDGARTEPVAPPPAGDGVADGAGHAWRRAS